MPGGDCGQGTRAAPALGARGPPSGHGSLPRERHAASCRPRANACAHGNQLALRKLTRGRGENLRTRFLTKKNPEGIGRACAARK